MRPLFYVLRPSLPPVPFYALLQARRPGKPDDNAVTIEEHDCVDGELPKKSSVKLSKLFTVHSTLVFKTMCALRGESSATSSWGSRGSEMW